MMKTNDRALLALGASVLGGCLLLTGCERKPEEPTTGQRVDQAIGSVEQGADKAKVEVQQMAQDAKAAGSEAMDQAGAAVSDAAITARVNAELAQDRQLSALSINVDTQGGHVALKGKAPNAQARERATSLAAAVKGVLSVDNQLRVDAS